MYIKSNKSGEHLGDNSSYHGEVVKRALLGKYRLARTGVYPNHSTIIAYLFLKVYRNNRAGHIEPGLNH